MTNPVESSIESPCRATNPSRLFLWGLALIYALVWIGLAINPVNRLDWLLENLLVFAAWMVLAFLHGRIALSGASWLSLTLFLLLHAYGAHYTYSLTPLGNQLAELLEWQRNHYDRLVHFAFGLLLTLPLAEALSQKLLTGKGRAVLCFAVIIVLALSALYELIEWVAAMILDPEEALAFLGTQGDIFDAQKDTGLAFLGSLCALPLAWKVVARK